MSMQYCAYYGVKIMVKYIDGWIWILHICIVNSSNLPLFSFIDRKTRIAGWDMN